MEESFLAEKLQLFAVEGKALHAMRGGSQSKTVFSELCTADSCTTMNGPNGAVYLWVDERGKKIKCSAPQYIDYVMAHCQQLVTAQDVFPTKYEQTFSSEYRPTIMKMMRLLWHVVCKFLDFRQLGVFFFKNFQLVTPYSVSICQLHTENNQILELIL